MDDQVTGWTAIQHAGAAASLVLIPAGTGPKERIGERVYIHSIHARMNFYPEMNNTSSNSAIALSVRLMLILDKQANGVQASATEALEYNNHYSYRNLNNVSRFNVLFDQTFVIKTDNVSSYTSGIKSFKWNKYLKEPIVVNFGGSTGGISEVTSTNLFWTMSTRQPPAHTGTWNGASVEGYTRLRFSD